MVTFSRMWIAAGSAGAIRKRSGNRCARRWIIWQQNALDNEDKQISICRPYCALSTVSSFHEWNDPSEFCLLVQIQSKTYTSHQAIALAKHRSERNWFYQHPCSSSLLKSN